jgi:DNA-binding transcriptional LysR family regulator
LNITHILTFLCVVYNHSISKAANILYVTQPAVSLRLRQLEKSLGVVLINRKKGNRGIELTAQGNAFVPVAERWLALNKETEQFSKQGAQLSLTIASPDSLNNYVFNRLFPILMEGVSSICLRIRTHQSGEIFSLVDDLDADIGFVFHLSRYSNVICKPVFKEKMLLICSAKGDWPDKPFSPEELDPQYELFLPWSQDIQRWHDYWWNPNTRPYVYVDIPSLIALYMDNPKCWALCPVSVANAFLNDSVPVKVRELTEPIPDRICYMLTNRTTPNYKSPAINYFERSLMMYIKKVDWLNKIYA